MVFFPSYFSPPHSTRHKHTAYRWCSQGTGGPVVSRCSIYCIRILHSFESACALHPHGHTDNRRHEYVFTSTHNQDRDYIKNLPLWLGFRSFAFASRCFFLSFPSGHNSPLHFTSFFIFFFPSPFASFFTIISWAVVEAVRFLCIFEFERTSCSSAHFFPISRWIRIFGVVCSSIHGSSTASSCLFSVRFAWISFIIEKRIQHTEFSNSKVMLMFFSRPTETTGLISVAK